MALKYKPNPPTDSELVDRCLKKDPVAQKMLYDRYKNRMMAFCIRYFQRTELAEEFFQEGFIRFFNKIEQYNPAFPLFPYLKKIFLHAGINYLQQFFSEKHTIFEPIQEGNDWATTDLPIMEYEELLGILSKLQDADALLLQMSLVEGLSHEEISALLQITVPNSRIRLMRARKKLIETIEYYYKHNK
jgi:RNA polymerase sigma-70 factor (ECF subfamily)